MSGLQRRTIELDGGEHVEYLEGGSGRPVVSLILKGAGDGKPGAAFLSRLAEKYRVLAPLSCGYDDSTGPSRTAREQAEVVAAFVQRVVGGPVAVIAESGAGAAGCWVAALQPASVDRLILISPTAFATSSDRELLERLGDIQAPTLIVWGTRDAKAAAEPGHVYQQRIANSHRHYIYTTAHTQPTAACHQFLGLATDFIERGDAFVVRQPDGGYASAG